MPGTCVIAQSMVQHMGEQPVLWREWGYPLQCGASYVSVLAKDLPFGDMSLPLGDH